MKRVFLLTIFLCVSILVIACSKENDNSLETSELQPTQYDVVNNFEGVSMDIIKESVSPAGLTVIFTNNSENLGIYGDYFILEQKIEGTWYQVPTTVDEYGFDDIGYELAPSTSREFLINWDWLYGTLQVGEYRIIKDMLDFRGPGDFDKYYLAAKFAIE